MKVYLYRVLKKFNIFGYNDTGMIDSLSPLHKDTDDDLGFNSCTGGKSMAPLLEIRIGSSDSAGPHGTQQTSPYHGANKGD